MGDKIEGKYVIFKSRNGVRQYLTIDEKWEEEVNERTVRFFDIAKCFTEAKGRKTTLKPESIFKHASTEIKARHNWLMRLRHEFVAHGGEAQEEQIKLLLVLKPEEEEKGVITLIGHGASAHNLEIELIQESQETVRYAARKISLQIDALQQKLLKKFDGEGLEWAYQNTVNG